MQSRKAVVNSTKSTIDAAALQADIARRFKLPGASTRRTAPSSSSGEAKKSSKSESSIKSSNLSSDSATHIHCVSCRSVNSNTANICSECGYFLRSASHQSAPSLAEMRGLVKAAPKVEVMVDSEWEIVEAKLVGRNDAFCPICMEGFNGGREVLLSCSHMFHRHCLTSFEKFMRAEERCCPVCRGTKYQKKITRQGSKAFEIICCTNIQKVFRGHVARKLYYYNIKLYYQKGKGGTSFHKTKFYEKELHVYMRKIDEDFQDRKMESDSVLSSVENTLSANRELDILFDNMMRQRTFHPRPGGNIPGYNPSDYEDDTEDISFSNSREHGPGSANSDNTEKVLSEVQWGDILLKAEERGFEDCAICMGSNSISTQKNNHNHQCGRTSNRGQRPILILSCSHIFHHHCIQNFEKFLVNNNQRACPVCRCSDYSKKILSTEDLRRSENRCRTSRLRSEAK